jgi:hypothetical protein
MSDLKLNVGKGLSGIKSELKQALFGRNRGAPLKGEYQLWGKMSSLLSFPETLSSKTKADCFKNRQKPTSGLLLHQDNTPRV